MLLVAGCLFGKTKSEGLIVTAAVLLDHLSFHCCVLQCFTRR